MDRAFPGNESEKTTQFPHPHYQHSKLRNLFSLQRSTTWIPGKFREEDTQSKHTQVRVKICEIPITHPLRLTFHCRGVICFQYILTTTSNLIAQKLDSVCAAVCYLPMPISGTMVVYYITLFTNHAIRNKQY